MTRSVVLSPPHALSSISQARSLGVPGGLTGADDVCGWSAVCGGVAGLTFCGAALG